MDNNQLLPCDICGNEHPAINITIVLQGCCICKQCVEKILTFYVYTYPIKTLCPYCQKKETMTEPCQYCNIDIMLQRCKTTIQPEETPNE